MSAYGQADSNGTSGSLYGLCARVPLIKSPAVRVPPPVALPSSLHPLPPNLQEYFVYPFSLERFVLDAADRREKARREDLQRRAPGWSEGAGMLEPIRRTGARQDSAAQQQEQEQQRQQQPAMNEIDEIAQMLEKLERP